MSDRNRFLATIYDRTEDREFSVIVYGVTEETAADKVKEQYKPRRYVLREIKA